MRYVWAILAVVVVIVALVAVKGAQIGRLIGMGKQMEKDGPPPESVSTFKTVEQVWENTIPGVGTVASGKGVGVSTEASGTVSKISFESGATVKAGQILVELDSSVERAQLATAIARRDLAAQNVGRTRALAGKNVLSQAQIDADESALRTASAEAESIQVQIAKKTIRAPFAGKLGIRAVNVGQYLNAGTPVTTLETVESMHVDFSLPQQRLSELSLGMPVRVSVDQVVPPDAPGELAARSDAGAPPEAAVSVVAKLGAIDPSIDPTTRAVKLRADLDDDKNGTLRNGMFVNVAVVLPEKTKRLSIPVTAIVHAPYGDSVFVVEPKPKDAPGLRTTADGKTVMNARQQFVKVGPSRGDFVAILDGIKVDQDVVSAGAFKLRNNAPVVVDNSKQAKPSLEPHPENK